MAAGETVRLLESFTSGRIDIDEFDQQLRDTLFELCQDPALTDEKKLLSRIQLYLHEFDEGNRDVFEVYMATQAALDLLKPPITLKTVKGNISRQPILPKEFLWGTVSRPRDITHRQYAPVPIHMGASG